MASHPQSQCETCGAIDDHPKHHVVTQDAVDGQVALRAHTYHHDCVPFTLREAVSTPELEAILKAREDGKRGDELREFIVSNQKGADDTDGRS